MLPESVLLADPIFVRLPVPLITPDKFKFPVEEPMDVSLAKTIGLEIAIPVLELVNAPPLLMPEPFRVRVLVLDRPKPLRSSAAKLATDIAPPKELPSALLWPTFKVPAEMVVPPVKLLEPVRVKVAAATLVKAKAPLTTPLAVMSPTALPIEEALPNTILPT